MNLSQLVFLLHTKLIVLLAPLAFYIQETRTATDTGVSRLWLLANISFAGMRAQDSSEWGWRIIAFIFGFPGTLLSLIVITQGSGRAYGIEIPKKKI